jgi:hypothetical protein
MSRTRFACAALVFLLAATLAAVPASAKERSITIDFGDPDEDGLSLSITGSWLAEQILSEIAEDIDCDERTDRDMQNGLLHLRKRGEGSSYTIHEDDETVRLSRRKGKLEIRKTERGEEPTYVTLPWAMGECMLGNPKPMRKLAKDGFQMRIEKEGHLLIDVD